MSDLQPGSSPFDRIRLEFDDPLPLASQLADQLRWLVASGQLETDSTLPPIRAMADRLGINLHTVRAAYSQLEKLGLARVRRGRSTTILAVDRSKLAGSIPSLPTFTIGVLIPSYSGFYTPFLTALETAADDEPLMFLVCNTRESSTRAAQWVNQLLSRHVDGIVIASRGLPQDMSIESGWDPPDGFPPVVYADIPGSPAPRVLFDHQLGGQLAAEHFVGHDRQRPAIITPPRAWANVAEVCDGFTHGLAQADLALLEERVVEVPDFQLDSGRRAAEQLLALPEPPDAIFANGDYLAAGALQALAARGLTAGAEVSVIGYGDTEISGLVSPPLTTARLEVAGMGEIAMHTLRRLMANQPVDRETRLPVSLTLRASCGCEPADPD